MAKQSPKKQRQHEMLDEIFKDKNFSKKITFYEDELKEICHAFVDHFDIDDQSIENLRHFSLKPFQKRSKDSEFVGFYDYYPLNFEGKFVNTSKVAIKQGALQEPEDLVVDLSVLETQIPQTFDENLKKEALDEKLEREKFLVHEMAHFFGKNEIEVLDENGNALSFEFVNTKEAKNGKIIVFNGGNEIEFASLDENGKLITFEERSQNLEFDLADILDGDFEKGSIGAMIKNEDIKIESEEEQEQLNNQFNMKSVVLSNPENTEFGTCSNNFHEGMTELMAQKIVLSGKIPSLEKLSKDKKLFEESKGYQTETAFLKMIEALNGKTLEKIYFDGVKNWPLPVLNDEFVDDFCCVYESFSPVLELLFQNDMFFEDIDFAETEEEKEDLRKEQKVLQEDILKELEEFCKNAKSVLKREQKDVKKALNGNAITFLQLKNYLKARNEFIDPENWIFEFFYGTGVDEQKASEIVQKNFKEFLFEPQKAKAEKEQITPKPKKVDRQKIENILDTKEKIKKAEKDAKKLKQEIERTL